jgi:DNA-binding response OmpR family regulator
MTRCLLVDADAAARASLSRYLASYAFTVRSGATAQDLQRLAQAEPFDIVLLNLTEPHPPGDMDGMDGLALCRWVHEVARLPLIVMTDPARPQLRIDALEAGADDHIDPPHEPREVVARIRAVLRSMAKRAPVGRST